MKIKITKPRSSLEKTELARKLYEEMKAVREMRDIAGWYMSKILYYFDKYGLHNYLFGRAMSKNTFYAEIDIPISTVSYHTSLYDFYINKHRIKIQTLKGCANRKLHRGISILKDKSHEKVLEAVEIAKKETLSLSDFLKEIQAL